MIVKYTKRVQELLGSQVTAKPDLHACIMQTAANKSAYVIYVWDTRKIIDSGYCNVGYLAFNIATRANDNGKPLVGNFKVNAMHARWLVHVIGAQSAVQRLLKSN